MEVTNKIHPNIDFDWKQKLAEYFGHKSFEDFNTDEKSIAEWIEVNVINKIFVPQTH